MGEGEFKGAGFIIVQPETNCILALIKDSGQFDLPKGHAEEGEAPLTTAKRECFEECAILIEDDELLDVGPWTADGLVVFAAVTDKLPIVLPNPDTGSLEHIGFKWVTPSQFMEECISYLVPFINALMSAKSTPQPEVL